MNSIRQIQALNKRELENAIPPEASWHADYRDTAYIYIGGLPYDLSEGDIVTIFSQYGEPVHVNLVRDKETGKSRGFAFLKYEDQRSTDLAVDNLGGATVLDRILRVDHVRYKKRDDEEGDNVAKLMGDTDGKSGHYWGSDDERQKRKKRRSSESDDEPRQRPLLKEEMELEELIKNHDDEDPMKENHRGEETPAEKDQVAIAITAIIATDMRSVGRVHGRRAVGITGHNQERGGPIEPDPHRGKREPTEIGHQWDPDHLNHDVLKTGTSDTDKGI
ncbi:uncharacterized protein ATNIH1004_005830 [Aspergillus tanneri]|uniref:RRM domain-containing protein n=1 Tax=Aspergillus tanneri TaxID=1220188 RepID=A0A5M9MJE0_9EURO|nr:uncharacterized protein ATNIH1004_005830 [Aspergillus tanneri]KAA8647142.1 hypothetical protein ATNIH1004_005830 [Aspergillus tanneri]